MKSTQLERIAAIYGCEIMTNPTEDGDAFYAKYGKQEQCLILKAGWIAPSEVHRICQELSGKTIMQFWTGASEVKS